MRWFSGTSGYSYKEWKGPSYPDDLGADSLVAGKLVGVTLFAWIAVRLKLGRLPEGARWGHVVGVAALADAMPACCASAKLAFHVQTVPSERTAVFTPSDAIDFAGPPSPVSSTGESIV